MELKWERKARHTDLEKNILGRRSRKQQSSRAFKERWPWCVLGTDRRHQDGKR